MRALIKKIQSGVNQKTRLLISEETGEVNLVAILLIIIVTVGLVAIFKTQITNLINAIFQNITNAIDSI